MNSRTMEPDTADPGLLSVDDTWPIGSIPFAFELSKTRNAHMR